jgi:hypothetical protein
MLEDRTNIANVVLPDSVEPLFNLPELHHVVDNVRILEEWYSTTYRRRITEITQLLSNQITEELRCQFEQERRPLIEPDPDHRRSESTIDSREKEIEEHQERSQSNDGFSEVDRIEKLIREIEIELEHSFTVDSVPLSRLLQLRTTQTDLKSYLRGLKFCVGKSAAQSRAAEELSLQS